MKKQKDDNSERSRYSGWKDLDRKGKIQYIFDYYLLHIVMGVGALILLTAAIIYYGFTSTTNVMYMMGVGAEVPAESVEALSADVSSYLELDKRHVAEWENATPAGTDDYMAMERMYTLVGAGAVDLFICNEEWFRQLADMGAIRGLEELVDPAVRQELLDSGSIIMVEQAAEDGGGLYDAAIDISGSKAAQDAGIAPLGGSRVLLCLSAGCKHTDEAKLMLSYFGIGK